MNRRSPRRYNSFYSSPGSFRASSRDDQGPCQCSPEVTAPHVLAASEVWGPVERSASPAAHVQYQSVSRESLPRGKVAHRDAELSLSNGAQVHAVDQ